MSAFAAVATLSSVFTSNEISDWVAVLMLSTVSGLTALMQRVRRDMEARVLRAAGRAYRRSDRLLLSWRAVMLFHLTGSYMAGLVGFFVGSHLQVDIYLQALLIALFAWGGTAILDRIAGRGVSWVSRIVDAALNTGTPQDKRE